MEIFKLFGSIFVNTDEAETSISRTEESAEDLGNTLSDGVETASKWGTAIAVAAVAAGTAVVTAACSISDSVNEAMSHFAQATGVAIDSMEEYEDVLKSIYASNYGESLDDIAAAMAEVKKQAGDVGADGLQNLTQSALVLRDAFEYDVSESTRAAIMLMDQFGLTGEEAFNLIAQGAQGGLDKNGDLLDSINEYSVHFKQLGYDAEDMFNILKSGAEAGTFSVDKLGDAMKEFGIRAKDGSDSTRAAFETLGVDADVFFNIYNKGGTAAAEKTQEIIEKLAKMPDGIEKTTTGVALFGSMWEDLGAEGIEALANINGEISLTKDALNGLNEVEYNTIEEALEGLKRQIEMSVLEPLGDALLPVINAVISALQSITEWMGKHEEVVAVVTGVVLGLVGAFALLKGAMALESLIQGVTTAITGMNAAMAANPIGLVVVAIAGLVAALTALGVIIYENWDAIKAWCSDLGSKVKTTFTNIGNTISSTASNIKDNLTNKFNEAKNNVANHLEQMQQNFTSGLERMRTGAGNILNNIGNSFSNTFSNAKNSVQKALEKIKGFFDFEWKLPDIKLPHFNIQPSGWKFGDLLKGKIPTLDIEWYAKGGVMTQPTAFGYNNATNSLMVGGEAGAEAIAPISTLQKYVSDAVAANNSIIAEAIDEAIMRMINFLQANQNSNNMQVVLDSGVLVGEIAPAMDKQLGNMVNKRNRGN